MIAQEISLAEASYVIWLTDIKNDPAQKKIAEEKKPYKLKMLRDLASRLQPDDLVLDIGAQVGNCTLYLAETSSCRVVSIEEDKRKLEALENSIKTNNLLGSVTLKAELPKLESFYNVAAIIIQNQAQEILASLLDSGLRNIGSPFIYINEQEVILPESYQQELVQQDYEIRSMGHELVLLPVNYLDIVEGRQPPFFKWAPKQFLSEENKEVESCAQKIQKELEEVNIKYRNLSGNYNNIKDKLDLANEKYREVTAHVSILKKQKEQLEEKINQQKQNCQLLLDKHENEREKALSSLEQRLIERIYSNENSAKKQLEKELLDLRALQVETKIKMEAKLKELKIIKGDYEQLRKKYCFATERELPELKAQLEAHVVQVEELKEQLKEQEKTHSEDRVSLEQEAYKLNERVIEQQRELSEQEKMLSAQKAQLEVANKKYRDLSGQTLQKLKEKLDSQAERARKLQQRAEFLNRELKQSREEKAAAQRALSAMRSSLTYKAGTHFRAASGSVKDALKLPVRLWRLHKLAAQKKLSAGLKSESNPIMLQPAAKIDHTSLYTNSLVDKPRRQVRMACIMDDFTYGSYQPECELYQLTPKYWQQELEAFQPEVLFIESAWRGKDEQWGNKVGHCSQEIQGIIAWCRERHIPTLFWNKEDPVHFETFLTTAQLFDFVFTTDMDCIHRYKAALGHEQVYFLPFACQPAVHNPIEKYARKEAFCFAGAYYVRYPERTRDLESFVQELPSYRPLDIYDRNFGKNDPNYQFPEAYQPHIVGTLPFSEIDKAYKGYRYAINLNSIKQSQTMFARRVYELLGSNTLTISNYSRGLRLMFGDLVVTSDSGSEIRRRLEQLETGSVVDRLRLAGLRKVMCEHTYADRMNYILEKITGVIRTRELPAFTVIALANSKEEAQAVIANVLRQQSVELELLLVCDKSLKVSTAQAILKNSTLKGKVIAEKTLPKLNHRELIGEHRWVCGMCAADYYGASYLLDIALATRYSDAQVIGKAAYFSVSEETGLVHHNANQAYHTGHHLAARRAVIHPALAQTLNVKVWLHGLESWKYQAGGQLAIDSYNYCEGAGNSPGIKVTEEVDDVQVSEGVPLVDLCAMAETIEPMQSDLEHAPWLDGAQFAHALLGEPFAWLNGHGLAGSKDEERSLKLTRNKDISARLIGPLLEVNSQLLDGKHDYIYAAQDLLLKSLEEQLGTYSSKGLPLHLQIDPGLSLSLVVLYLGPDKQRLGHDVLQANRNVTIMPADGTRYLRLGLRIYAGGSCKIHRLVLGHLDLEPENILGQSDVLLLTNHYPSYDDLYRNGFVHSRVKAYREHGATVDVFRLRTDQPIHWHEFQNVDVTTGSQQALRRMLASGRYRHVLVHFLDPDMWDVLKDFIDIIKVTVWVHGAEVQPWYRRSFEKVTLEQEAELRLQGEEKIKFWRGLFAADFLNLKFVFVSKCFAKEVFEDVGIELKRESYEIIHNPIDTSLFSYEKKSGEQRFKVLTIRPFASRVYANDLLVRTIEILSKEEIFDRMEFKIVGDGVLFDEVLAPLKGMKNVFIQKKFLEQAEIARLHKEYGIFLCPSRYDTHGVSRDEARSSGLVAVTNDVGAISEFITNRSSELVAAEDCQGLANAIKKLACSPEIFLEKSAISADEVRDKVCKNKIIAAELMLVGGILNDESGGS